jgi:succinyl-diaminopimelate desuccinylase
MPSDSARRIPRDEVIDLTRDLIKISSPYFHEERIMEFAHSWLAGRGLSPEYHRYHEDQVTDFRGTNVLGRLRGGRRGTKVLLNAHLDTVEVCNGWSRDPLDPVIDGNRLYGLGALDMKSGAAAMMLALDAFKRDYVDFSGEIIYSLVSDEEGPYGLGTRALVRDGLISDAEIAIIPEPSSGFSGAPYPCLCMGARGGFSYTVRFLGKAAHAADPEKGICALTDMSKAILELNKAELRVDDKLGKGAICILSAQGGGKACSVADEASFNVFRHVVRGEDEAYIRTEIEHAIERARIRGAVAIEFRPGVFGRGGGFEPYIAEESDGFVAAFRNSIAEATGKEPAVRYFSSIGDFNTIASGLGIPTLVFGPDGENYHSRDEYVDIDSVVSTAACMYTFLENVLS